jgi:DNA-directed RNA polymerase subunit RPC12/RpoP
MTAPLNHVPCPACGSDVDDRVPACPSCGEKIYVEHPGDMKRVRHRPLNLPPAKPGAYGPSEPTRGDGT